MEKQEKIQLGRKNIIKSSLVDLNKVVLLLFHIKLGLTKLLNLYSFTKSWNFLKYLCQMFPVLSDTILKLDVFTRPGIKKISFWC